MPKYILVILTLLAGVGAAGGTILADTTDREYDGSALRDDEAHQAAWQTLIGEQEAAQRAGGGLFRRASCGAADFNKPECQVDRDNGGGDSGGGDH